PTIRRRLTIRPIRRRPTIPRVAAGTPIISATTRVEPRPQHASPEESVDRPHSQSCEEAQHPWAGIGAEAARFLDRVHAPEMAGPRHHDRPREEASLLERGQELFRLRRRIDDVALAPVD